MDGRWVGPRGMQRFVAGIILLRHEPTLGIRHLAKVIFDILLKLLRRTNPHVVAFGQPIIGCRGQTRVARVGCVCGAIAGIS